MSIRLIHSLVYVDWWFADSLPFPYVSIAVPLSSSAFTQLTHGRANQFTTSRHSNGHVDAAKASAGTQKKKKRVGWSNEGKLYFNKLCVRKIPKDRVTYGEKFNVELRLHMQRRQKVKSQQLVDGGKPKSRPKERVVPYDDLFRPESHSITLPINDLDSDEEMIGSDQAFQSRHNDNDAEDINDEDDVNDEDDDGNDQAKAESCDDSGSSSSESESDQEQQDHVVVVRARRGRS